MDTTLKAKAYINKQDKWKEGLTILRELMLSTGLEEAIKWGIPVYTFQGKNIVGLAAFKSFYGLWFFQGGLLRDEAGKLTNAQEGITKAQRQWRFTTVDEIDRALIRAYVEESINNQKEGKTFKPVKNIPLILPEELKEALKADKEAGENFEGLTLSKKREFATYIAEAKRPATKQSRLDKIIPMIIAKEGLHDKYKK